MKRGVGDFIERSGLLWEQDGLPRIAGRIFALTLLSTRALSLDEIAETLGVSKASVSNDTRLLERLGFLERVRRPRDRKDYYQASEQSFERAISERVRRLDQLQELLETGKALAVDSPAVRARLEDHHFAFAHVTAALRSALEQLRARHRTRRSEKT